MTSTRTPSRSHARAFTLLEVLLATMLAGMVVIAAISLFATLDRSHRRHEVRMQRALETALAQRTMQRAFSSLLMSEGAEPREDEIEKRREDDRRRAEGTESLRFDDRALEARFALQPSDPEAGGTSIGGRPTQLLALTLRSRPLGGANPDENADSALVIDERGRVLTREEADARTSRSRLQGGLETLAARRENRLRIRETIGTGRTGTSTPDMPVGGSFITEDARGEGKSGGGSEGKRSNTDQNINGNRRPNNQRTGDAPVIDQPGLNSIPGLEGVAEAGRAPGVRGVFEILPDDPATPVGSSVVGVQDAPTQEAGVAVWWRELPPIITQAGITSSDDQSASNQQAALVRKMQLMGAANRRVKLLGGLRSAEFKVMRSERLYTKMAATWAGELPAHIEFSFETLAGTKEDWLFEVAWALGAEPGTPLNSSGIGAASIPPLGKSTENPIPQPKP